MDLRVESDADGVFTVCCECPMEWRARETLVAAVADQVQDGECRGVIVDMANVSFISSAGLASLFALRRFTEERGAEVVIARPTPAIRRVLNLVELPAQIPVTDALDDARAQLVGLQAPSGN